MVDKSINKEEIVKHSVRIIEVLEFLNEAQLGVVSKIELDSRFGSSVISNMKTRGFLEYFGNKDAGLTIMGFNFLIQQKINKNIDQLNASVTKLNNSSYVLNWLTVFLIVLTAILLVYEITHTSIYLIILFLILLVPFGWFIKNINVQSKNKK